MSRTPPQAQLIRTPSERGPAAHPGAVGPSPRFELAGHAGRRPRPGRWDASRGGGRCWQGRGRPVPRGVELFDRVGDPLLGRHDERRRHWRGRIPWARMRFPAMLGYSGPGVRCPLWGLHWDRERQRLTLKLKLPQQPSSMELRRIAFLALPERRGGSGALNEVIARWTHYQGFRNRRRGRAELGRVGCRRPGGAPLATPSGYMATRPTLTLGGRRARADRRPPRPPDRFRPS